MTDWRAMMHGSFSPPQYPQNPQNRSNRSRSEDCEKDFEEAQTKSETASRISPEPRDTLTDHRSSALSLRPGQWVEWLSPALPTQQGEVVALDADHFEVYHPLAETLCRLPISWVTRVVKFTTNQEGPTP